MPLQIIRNDITKVKADAIVNSANTKPIYGSGTDESIYRAAGASELLAERKKIGPIAPGAVAVTPAFALKAKYIIHTVGPVWIDGMHGEFDILRSCYTGALEAAQELKCESIAFPLIATGADDFPREQALRIAMDAIGAFLMRDGVEMAVKLVVYDQAAFRLSRDIFYQVESFINDAQVLEAHRRAYGTETDPEKRGYRRRYREVTGTLRRHPDFFRKDPDDEDTFDEDTFDRQRFTNDGSEGFAFRNHLIKLLQEKGIDNHIAYKRSNVSRKVFSKILCGETLIPQKKTVLGFCIGLRLTIEESQALLACADMAFNPYNKRDRLVIQCILHEQYDVRVVNEMLYACGQPLLGTEN
ncbi:MAG: macro domain-containing protein [Lachnospiraceae bacterium]|nr:macro domain-containing protein [Lachnospiraceae bacterium]